MQIGGGISFGGGISLSASAAPSVPTTVSADFLVVAGGEAGVWELASGGT